MKKTVSIILTLALIFSSFAVMNAFAVSFSDLEGHWGKSYIDVLVNDGTINGYDDGTFRPDGTVTRAEFVKMIGKGSEKTDVVYTDVPADHWGYDYIMYSGFDVSGTQFMPDKAITRGEVLNLIWKRNGSKTGISAPSVITSQSDNKDAVAWGYTYGIMTGDDGLNLRLGDTLTRAEGAALIVRAREINENSPAKDFADIVSPDVLKAVFNSQTLFDREYNPDSAFTNGEMARAVLRFGSRQYNLTFKNVSAVNELDCEYGKEFYVTRGETLGGTPNTAEFVGKNANVGDTLSEMCYNLIKLVTKSAKFDTSASYPDVTSADSTQKKYLDYAASNGICLFADGKIHPDKEITMKEFAAVLLQLDAVIGTQVSYASDGRGTNENLNTDVAKYPENYGDYTAIIKSIPNYVYSNKISSAKASESYSFASAMKQMFVNPLSEMEKTLEKGGIKANITYYPTLVTNPESYFVYRVKVSVSEADNASLAAALGDKYKCADIAVNSGNTVWVDLKFKLPMGDLLLFYTDAEIVNTFIG